MRGWKPFKQIIIMECLVINFDVIYHSSRTNAFPSSVTDRRTHIRLKKRACRPIVMSALIERHLLICLSKRTFSHYWFYPKSRNEAGERHKDGSVTIRNDVFFHVLSAACEWKCNLVDASSFRVTTRTTLLSVRPDTLRLGE